MKWYIAFAYLVLLLNSVISTNASRFFCYEQNTANKLQDGGVQSLDASGNNTSESTFSSISDNYEYEISI